MADTQRVIIGETLQAGLPISAPENPAGPQPEIRWVKKHDTFVLESLVDGDLWVEVPFIS